MGQRSTRARSRHPVRIIRSCNHADLIGVDAIACWWFPRLSRPCCCCLVFWSGRFLLVFPYGQEPRQGMGKVGTMAPCTLSQPTTGGRRKTRSTVVAPRTTKATPPPSHARPGPSGLGLAPWASASFRKSRHGVLSLKLTPDASMEEFWVDADFKMLSLLHSCRIPQLRSCPPGRSHALCRVGGLFQLFDEAKESGRGSAKTKPLQPPSR